MVRELDRHDVVTSAAESGDADARQQQGDKFDLRAFHDFLWKNGNVPFALLRWELLGDKEEIGRVDAARRRLKY